MVITMTVTEKAAYLKGVVSMLKLDENSDEAKVLNVLAKTGSYYKERLYHTKRLYN